MHLNKAIKHQSRPFLIAGPCSVESEEQLMSIVEELKKQAITIHLFRGGIWKPRTRPNSFEGVGEIGLPWLVKAGKELGVPVTTEVANSAHVEFALKAGVDVLWIGARTTANPFAVQEIADSLKGTQIPVMIKNPINPDLNLWLGAFERLQNSGLTDLTAIHRGFSVYNHPKYRNEPKWNIPIAFMEAMPHIPLICDPSHIAGNRDGLLYVAQKSMDLNFDGLMIETHTSPDEALSDSKQQIVPKQLNSLLQQIVIREGTLEGEQLSYMELKRNELAEIDDQIFSLLKGRMEIAQEVGNYKRENNIPIFQPKHWKDIINQRLSQAEKLQLNPIFIRSILDAIHQESIRHQNKVMNEME